MLVRKTSTKWCAPSVPVLPSSVLSTVIGHTVTYAGRMGQALAIAAHGLGCSERTLRRCIADGTLHGRRVGARQVELSIAEQDYLKSHWRLLKAIRSALRTERDVRLAVLFGSTATGENHLGSDVDVLIAHRRDGQRVLAGLKMRLRRALGKPIHIVSLEQAKTCSSLLADILCEGRVLVDRDDLWPELTAQYDEVLAQAAHEEQVTTASALNAVAAARARIR
jgi:predicted nucleotidyltransferase